MTTQDYSKRERELMKQYMESHNIKSFQFSPDDSFEQWDGKMIDGETRIIFEVKVRNIPSYKYSTTIIDETKYNFLLDYTKDTDVQPYIFIFFSDGKVLKKNLKVVARKTLRMKAPIMTSENKGEKLKDFVEIPITELNLENY